MENVHGFQIGATRFERYRLYFEFNKLFAFIQAISEDTQFTIVLRKEIEALIAKWKRVNFRFLF